ncbi:MAG: lysylphosphatidylglycerol synthase transmembrane domain-containing protein [Candidatus Methanoperedens sp.]|nr:lysylphosphatidylglycerol synthase transmembrane domain-containing protein [Candidatus Methanoperedens sp.]
MERFRKRNILFVIIIGVIILTVFTNQIGPSKLISLLGNVNKPLILLVLIFNLFNLIAFTKTWQLLSSTEISFFKLFKFYMIGAFVSNITPSFGSGGEPVKAMLLGKETGMSKAECFAGVVSQRMLNMFPFLVLSILGLGLLFFDPSLRLGIWELIALLFSLLLGIGMFVLLIYFYVRKDKLSSFVHYSIRFLAPFI